MPRTRGLIPPTFCCSRAGRADGTWRSAPGAAPLRRGLMPLKSSRRAVSTAILPAVGRLLRAAMWTYALAGKSLVGYVAHWPVDADRPAHAAAGTLGED